MTIRILLRSGEQLTDHNHAHRDEVWVVVFDHWLAIVDGHMRQIGSGDVVHMPVNCEIAFMLKQRCN